MKGSAQLADASFSRQACRETPILAAPFFLSPSGLFERLDGRS